MQTVHMNHLVPRPDHSVAGSMKSRTTEQYSAGKNDHSLCGPGRKYPNQRLPYLILFSSNSKVSKKAMSPGTCVFYRIF